MNPDDDDDPDKGEMDVEGDKICQRLESRRERGRERERKKKKGE